VKLAKKLARLCMLLALAATAGCSAFGPKLETPRLTLLSVGMTSADVFNQHFLVRMHVTNPNDRDLPIKFIEYQLFLQGDSFAKGTSSRPFVIPALGETEFDLTVRTHFVSSVGRLLSRLHGSQQVEYVIEGTVHADRGLVRKIPFREGGIVDLSVLR